jgi:hypothetical protein
MDEAYYSNLHLIRALCRLKTGQINAALDDLKTTRTNKLQLLFNKGACVYEDYTVTLQRDSLMEECYIAKYNGKNRKFRVRNSL